MSLASSSRTAEAPRPIERTRTWERSRERPSLSAGSSERPRAPPSCTSQLKSNASFRFDA
eukprot:scaffold225712_cov32-Tisochrysis_lutea.AAC.8